MGGDIGTWDGKRKRWIDTVEEVRNMRQWRTEISYDSKAPGVEFEWHVCPACGGEDIDGMGVDIVEGQAIQRCGCATCGSTWHDVYRMHRKVEIVYAKDNVLMELMAQDLSNDHDMSAKMEHTGGGIQVVYVRTLDLEALPDAHVGITINYEGGEYSKWLVCAYPDDDSDGTDWFREDVDGGDVATIAGEAIVWLNKLAEAGMTLKQAKAWAQGKAQMRGVRHQDKGWTTRTLVGGYLDYNVDIEDHPNETFRPSLIRLANIETGERLYGVYWIDQIGVNEWMEWFDTHLKAVQFLSRLTMAVLTNRLVAEISVPEIQQPF